MGGRKVSHSRSCDWFGSLFNSSPDPRVFEFFLPTSTVLHRGAVDECYPSALRLGVMNSWADEALPAHPPQG